MDETRGKIEQRGKINVRLLDENIGDVVRRNLKQQYAEAERDVKRSVRRDKRRFVDQTAKGAEDAARRQDTRTLFRIGKSLGRKAAFGGQCQIKDRDGGVLMSESDQRERWAGHFLEVLNRESPVVRIEPFHLEELEISIEPLSEDEIKVCIRRMKSNKAAGVDNVSAE